MLHAQWKRAPWRRRTLGADKAYDVHELVDITPDLGTTPHVAQNLARPGGSAIDGRTTRHRGYANNITNRANFDNPTVGIAGLAGGATDQRTQQNFLVLTNLRGGGGFPRQAQFGVRFEF
jgi:hypothetical protein